MKTLLCIAVGSMLLFSNTMVLAAPSQPVRAREVNYTVFNQTMQDLNYSEYQLPKSLKEPMHDITIPSPSLLPAVGHNSQQSFMLGMAPGDSYLAYGISYNNFCTVKVTIPNNQDNPITASTVNEIGTKHLTCTISVSGNQVTMTIKQQPKIITVTVTNNDSEIPLKFYQYQPSRSLPGMSPPPLPQLSTVEQGSPANITVTLLPGSSYFTYGYNDDNFCRFRLHTRTDGHLFATKTYREGKLQCQITFSESSVNINISASPSDAESIFQEQKRKTQPYSIIIQNNTITSNKSIRHSLVFHKASSPNMTSIPTTLSDITEAEAQQNFPVKMSPGDELNLSYGIDEHNFCKFKIVYTQHRGIYVAPPDVHNNVNHITCNADVGHNNIIILTIGLEKWLLSKLCVENHYSKHRKRGERLHVRVTIDGNRSDNFKTLAISNKFCWDYYKTIKAYFHFPDAQYTYFNAEINSLDKSGVVQEGLLSNILVSRSVIDHVFICFASSNDPMYKTGNRPSVRVPSVDSNRNTTHLYYSCDMCGQGACQMPIGYGNDNNSGIPD